jgi:hypothetical protein
MISLPSWRAAGIDPTSREALIADYLDIGTRIARLSEREGDAVLGNIQVTRAVNVLVAERRRLRTALFRGARRPKPFEPAPTPEPVSQREADTVWSDFLERFDDFADRCPEERKAREAELVKLYGEPSMRVLIMPHIGDVAVTRESIQDFFDWMDRRAAAAPASGRDPACR